MSRMGKVPIQVPDKVKLTMGANSVKVEGPKGQLSFDYKPFVSIRPDEGKFWVDRVDDSKDAKAHQGLLHRMITSMIKGVTDGYSKTLEIVGVGYKAEVAGQSLNLNIGYSHQVAYSIPTDIQIQVDKQLIHVRGIDKQRVGQIAAEIRGLRKPDNYKGKGIRYQGEHVRIKPGKAAVGAGF